MKLFVLREVWDEYFDDADEGSVFVGEFYVDIHFADTREKLVDMAAVLRVGHVGFWTLKRHEELRGIYPGYDSHRVSAFPIVDVSNSTID